MNPEVQVSRGIIAWRLLVVSFVTRRSGRVKYLHVNDSEE